MKDQKTVSNEFHELEYVAKKFNLTFQDVVDAKKATGSNKRDVIYAYLEALPRRIALTDELIEEAANKHVDLQYPMGVEREYPLDDFRAGARWMRDQLTGEAKS